MPLHPEAVSEFRFIQPCSPVTAKSVPDGDDWLHEPKFDGYRLQIAKHGRVMRLYSRRGHDPAHSAVVDAELCFPGPDGAPDFFRLLKAVFGNQGRELVVYAFDLLRPNGQDLAARRFDRLCHAVDQRFDIGLEVSSLRSGRLS